MSGAHTISFSWPELVWAAISVGRAELMHIARHGPFSAFEIVYRAAILFANLREWPTGHLTRSAAYEGLDPSEKGAVSYFVGLTVAKLFAERLLNVPWLMHLDVYRAELQAILHGAKRPDLVGQNTGGEWIAVESKGRTHGYADAAMLRAKEQVAVLASVKGQSVTLRVASQVYFGDSRLQCALRDPDATPEDARRIDLPLERERFFEGYYRRYREWLPTAPGVRREAIRGQMFLVAELPEVDLTVGLREHILRAEKPDATERVRSETDDIARATEHIGMDGVLVRTGLLWSPEGMRLEPQARRL